MSDVFTKSRSDAPDGFFAWEAAGLTWLNECRLSNPDCPGVRVVDVFDVDSTHIDLGYLRPGRASASQAADFGAQLVATHGSESIWGAPPPGWQLGHGWIGNLQLPLFQAETWGEFFARGRIEPFITSLAQRWSLDTTLLRRFHTLCQKLCDGVYDDDSKPVKLHGDLWSGNIVWTVDGAVLIDPSAHTGHWLSDLAMMGLFGLPYLDLIYDAYLAQRRNLGWSVPQDWKELIRLHQIYPLLVHAVLFDPPRSPGAYFQDATAILHHFVG